MISDEEKDDDNKDFKWVVCKYSCFVRDIIGFVVGGLSSRFW